MNDTLLDTFPGNELHTRREALELSVEEVYKETRIPCEYIRALEAADFRTLPGPCYTKGFLKTYCECLKLDPAPFIRALEGQDHETTHGFFGFAKGGGKGLALPGWWSDVVTWATVCAVLLLAWLTYAVVVGPSVEDNEGQVEATVELLVPPAADVDY